MHTLQGVPSHQSKPFPIWLGGRNLLSCVGGSIPHPHLPTSCIQETAPRPPGSWASLLLSWKLLLGLEPLGPRPLPTPLPQCSFPQDCPPPLLHPLPPPARPPALASIAVSHKLGGEGLWEGMPRSSFSEVGPGSLSFGVPWMKKPVCGSGREGGGCPREQ